MAAAASQHRRAIGRAWIHRNPFSALLLPAVPSEGPEGIMPAVVQQQGVCWGLLAEQAPSPSPAQRMTSTITVTKGLGVCCSLPCFQLLAAQDDNEADLDETADHQGAGLLASRQEAWSQWVATQLAEARRKAEALEQRVHTLYKEVHADTPTPSAIDHYQLEVMQKDKAHQQHQQVQALVRPVAPPPPQPVAPLHQHAALPVVPPIMRAGNLPVHVRPPLGAPMPVLHHPHPGAHAAPHGWPPGVTSPRGLVGLPHGALPPPTLPAVGPGGLAPQPGLVPGMRLPLPGGGRPVLPPHLLPPGALPMGLGALPLQQQPLLLPLQQQQHQHQQRPQ